MIQVPFDVDQAGWGSVQTYEDWRDNWYDPHYLLIHWGGLTAQVPPEREDAVLRGWQTYHTESKGMRDIAYNYAVGDSGVVYRLRGLNANGSNKKDLKDPVTGKRWNDVTVAVVWIGGRGDPDGPSDAARRAMRRIADQVGLPVLVHSDMKATACPGDDWRAWRDAYVKEKKIMYVHWPRRGDEQKGQQTRWRIEQLQVWAAEAHLGVRYDPEQPTSSLLIPLGLDVGVYDDRMAEMLSELLSEAIYGYDGSGVGPREEYELLRLRAARLP